MFTDRFIQLPIKVYDREAKELTGKAEYEDSWMKINPFEISSWKPAEDNENNDVACTYVSMKNGDGFYVYYTTEQFEELLNSHPL